MRASAHMAQAKTKAPKPKTVRSTLISNAGFSSHGLKQKRPNPQSYVHPWSAMGGTPHKTAPPGSAFLQPSKGPGGRYGITARCPAVRANILLYFMSGPLGYTNRPSKLGRTPCFRKICVIKIARQIAKRLHEIKHGSGSKMVPDPSEAPGTRRTFQDVFGPLATRIVRRTPCFRKVYIIKMARQSAKPLREIK